MRHSVTKTLRTNQAPIKFWRSLSRIQRKQWAEYFELKPVDWKFIRQSRHYGHHYQYQLTADRISQVVFCIVLGILRYNERSRMQRIFFAMSGGLDSSTVCALVAKAQKLAKEIGQPFQAYGLGLPIESNPNHHKQAQKAAQQFGVRYFLINELDSVYTQIEKPLIQLAGKLRFNREELRKGLGNSKARLRMIVNFFASTKPGGYVLSTDNLSELYMAFWTLLGDVGAFGPIQHILKGLELPAIAMALGVPNLILDAKPTDGLSIHDSLDHEEGGDADAFGGITYPHLDAIICHAVKAGLKLDNSFSGTVSSKLIDSPLASRKNIRKIITQITSPASIWKRKHGSIGTSLTRQDIGLQPLAKIATELELIR